MEVLFNMASKNQKFNSYTLEFKYKIIEEKIKTGASYKELSKKYNVPEGSIITWIHTIKRDGALEIKKRGQQQTVYKDYKERYEILKKFQDFLVTKTQNKR